MDAQTKPRANGGLIPSVADRLDMRYLLLAPALGYVFVLLLVPLGYLAFISLHPYDAETIVGAQLTLENYLRLVGSSFYRGYIVYTIKLAVIVTVLCVLLGYPVGYYLGHASARQRSVVLFLVVLPLMAGLVVRMYGWLRIFGERGIANQLWLLVFDGRLHILNTTTAVVIGLVGVLLPFVIIPVYSAVEGIDPSLERAAHNLGANDLETFTKVVFPLSLPGVVLGSVFAFTLSMSSVVTPVLLGGRNDVTIGALMYDVALTDFNWPFASSMAVTIAILNVVLIYLYFRLSRKYLEVQE